MLLVEHLTQFEKVSLLRKKSELISETTVSSLKFRKENKTKRQLCQQMLEIQILEHTINFC